MKFNFSVNVETNNETGAIEAVYFRIRDGKSFKTKEYANGSAFADFNRKGELLGVELLGPCNIRVLDQIAKNETTPAKRFVRSAIPREMVAV